VVTLSVALDGAMLHASSFPTRSIALHCPGEGRKGYYHERTTGGRVPGKEQAMPKNKRVADMAEEVLTRQAKAHIERTGEPFEEALKGVSRNRGRPAAWRAP
jgi:hypothetical protein